MVMPYKFLLNGMFVTVASLEPQGVSTSTFEPIALKPLSIVAMAMFFFNLGEYAALVTFPHVLLLLETFHGLAQPPSNASPLIIKPTTYLVTPSDLILWRASRLKYSALLSS